MTRFIDEHRGRFGVERICRVMQSAVSTYYAHRSRPRKVWHALRREGVDVGRDRVARLMAAQGLHGVRRGKRVRTTIPARRRAGRRT